VLGLAKQGRVAVAVGFAGTAVIAGLLLRAEDAWISGRLAWIAVLAVPFGLAVAALGRRPLLFVPAAVLAVVLSPMLWSGILLLLVPGVAYAWTFARGPLRTTSLSRRALVAVIAPILVTVTAVRLLSSETTERCTTTATSNGSSTACWSVPTRTTEVILLALVAVAAGWLLAPSANSRTSRDRHLA